MDDISNRTLAILLVTAIVVSLGATVFTLNNLGRYGVPTGRASDDYGKVNLTVESTISIILREGTLIDFGVGYVNSTDTVCKLAGDSTHANLSVTDDNGYVDDNNCWVSQTAAPPTPSQPFYIENDGNQDVQLDINCPSANTIFSGYAGHNRKNLTLFISNNETSACSASLTPSIVCDDTEQTVCGTFEYHQPAEDGYGDELEVGVELIIPDGTSFQEYNATIYFTAS